ncbi:uncharacterized protein LOC128549280 [Mercenaria mercenaria]|uniref:uncharacterized protein LOC128549280 n=1 Tax=Mercenaria mercenaria TaxID=6596 RepID=UPI00234E868C|nr:uncharacterized protein LOC128549280 [Mercenaria mercenaria]
MVGSIPPRNPEKCLFKPQRPGSWPSAHRYDTARRYKIKECIQTPTADLHSVVPKGRKCIHYIASVKCWPRVYKSQQVIKDLVERCSYFEDMFELPGKQQTDLLEIDIYIDSNIELDHTKLLVRCEKSETKGTEYLSVFQRNVAEESFSMREKFSGIFIDKEGVKLVEAVSSEQIEVVVANRVNKESFVEQPHQFELQRAKQELSSILELFVFEILTAKFNNLKQFYQNRMHEPIKDETGGSNESSTSELVKQHKDDVEQLLGEIIAFFKRSTLPENKRPVGLGFEKKEISEKVKEQLFGLDKTIRGCGYCHSTFNVNVEKLSDEEETMRRQKHITEFLERNGVTKIKFNIVSKSVAEYKRVGARISVPRAAQPTLYRKGTLGGFASFSRGKDESSCALFSQHVALGCSAKLYVDGDNGKLTEFGEILEDTLQIGSYDIAAAKIHDHHVPQCDVQFKNSENAPLPGKLNTPATNIDLQDLHVHLWGSVSTPGLGIIKIPKLSYPEMTETYMQIEDRNPSERMAVEGDSGAIVCADDLDDEHVHVISMLIGTNTDKEKLKDPNEKRTYIAFPVQKGVERLQMKTGGTFSLRGVSKDEQN